MLAPTMPISVFLLDLLPVMGELTERAVNSASDMVRIEKRGRPSLGATGHSDVLIVCSHSSPAPEGVGPIFSRCPSSLVVAIEERAGRSDFYELQPRRTDLGEVAPDDLVQLIRSRRRVRACPTIKTTYHGDYQ